MDMYRCCLIMLYFKQNGQNYSRSELAKVLGLSANMLETFIQYLLDEQMIHFEEYFFKVTIKGERAIREQGLGHFQSGNNIYFSLKINPSEAWAFDKVYLPKGFLKKV